MRKAQKSPIQRRKKDKDIENKKKISLMPEFQEPSKIPERERQSPKK